MGSSRDQDVVLLDSDSDSELQHVSKKLKVSGQLAPFSKPFMHDDGESPDDGKTSFSNGVVERLEETSSKGSSVLLSLSSPSLSSSDLEEFNGEGFSLKAEQEERELQQRALHGDVSATRKFLKINGPMAFLEKFLPPTASSEDILGLIVRLGFKPKNCPPLSQGENLLQLIKLLNLAMKRVRQLRFRLDTFSTIDHVLDKLQSAQKILVITGAGISTSLGIPDFRSSQGFYSRISQLGLDDPQDVFDLQMFHLFPSNFYSIAHMILPPDHVCAPLHKFIRLLQDKGKLLRNYTQNIDNLEANAGILQAKMIQCHGSFAFATCVTCGYQVKGETLYPVMRSREIPYCPKCNSKRKKLMNSDNVVMEESYGVMKPNITFFGEALPRLFHDHIARDLLECDFLISIGTSLKVAPVADIVDKLPDNIPQLLINKDPIGHCNFDVSLLGYCDDVVAYLCDRLGQQWEIDHPDYKSLVGDGHNLEVEETKDQGVFNVKSKQREAKLAAQPAAAAPVPDLVVLEPTLN